MADIKLALSKDKCISREAEHVNKQGGLYYPLHTRPTEADPGCWVYFILRHHLVARARAVEFVKFEEDQKRPLLDYNGKDIWKPGWKVKCADMELPLQSKGGFEGFRKVREGERERFEGAFAWPEE